MQATFRSIREEQPGPVWQSLFARSWESYRKWFLKEGETRRPGYISCRAALRDHLPELLPTWERLVELAGGGDHAARMLSLYRPAPYLSGCSQVVLPTGEQRLLIRNYDYNPRFFEGTILMSRWNGVKTIVQSDCLWGALDGMNEHGLAISLAFGGRSAVGDGFGIPLVLRYVLETCESAGQARAVLSRVPSHMSYNVSVLDRDGGWFTAYLAPGRPASFDSFQVATNHPATHQDQGAEWGQYARVVSSHERWRLLGDRIAEANGDVQHVLKAFLQPPVFSYAYGESFGTLYTAIYNPREGVVDYVWQNRAWRQSFDNFEEGSMTIRYLQPAVA